VKTGVEFQPIIDPKSGTWVGCATVDEETAEKYEDRDGFEVYADEAEAFGAPETEAPAAISESGDPLADAAKRTRRSLPKPPQTETES
jgi:hypothetical protein